jgi:uncharacterized protein (DUF58 family)
LGNAWFFIGFLLVLVAILLRLVPLFLVALLILLASGVARLWVRYALERLEYSRRLSDSRVFFGETVTLEVTVANRKILPLPWVLIQDQMPTDVTFLRGNPAPGYQRRSTLSMTFSLSWYHRITQRYPLQCLKRGYFTFGPTTMRSGDLFGFFFKETTAANLDHLMVYPRILPLEKLGIPSRDPFGDLAVRRHLFEDPVRVVTTRDYAPGDPLRRIHWKATARLRRLQSRVFEHTTSVDLALFLDVRTVDPPLWGQQEQLLETGIITAASIVNHAVQQDQRVGLFVNDSYHNNYQTIKIPPSDHPEQFMRVLEALAQLRGLPIQAIEDVLIRQGRSLPWRTTLAVVTAAPTDALMASFSRLRRVGRRVVLIVIGEKNTSISMNGLPVYHVSDQVYWRELESVQWDQVREGVRE